MKSLVLFVACGSCVLSLLSPVWSSESHSAHHKENTQHGAMVVHQHGQIEVSNQKTIPTVRLTVTADSKSGWNVHVETTHFRFAPENVNSEHVEGQGHAHLYVDGQKITRLYAHWYYLGNLAPGAHEIRVTLNANDHSDLVLHGNPIEAIVSVN